MRVRVLLGRRPRIGSIVISSLGCLPCQLDLRNNHSAAITAFTVRYSTVNLRIYFCGAILHNAYGEMYYVLLLMHDTSHMKGKASTAK